MTDTSTLRERIAIAISGAPFPSKQSLAKADRVLAIIDAQTEQPDLQLSAPKVGSAPQDQTEVSPAPDAVAEAVTADEVSQAIRSTETGICDTFTWVDDGHNDDGDLTVDGSVNVKALATWINASAAAAADAARQDERTAIAAYIGMSPSEVTDRQYHMEAIRTGRYRDDPLMQSGGWMEGGDG